MGNDAVPEGVSKASGNRRREEKQMTGRLGPLRYAAVVFFAERRWYKILVAILSSLAAVLLAAACHARIWTWTDVDDAALYFTTLEGRQPLIDEFRTGGIQAGDDIGRLIARTKPKGVHRLYVTWNPAHDTVLSVDRMRPPDDEHCTEYICANYQLPDYTRLWIAAKGGKLVYAHALRGTSWQSGQCVWSKRFFDDLNQLEWQSLGLWLAIVD